jgi:prepilin-type N-terminal cleavage/methylation domain-containing protein
MNPRHAIGRSDARGVTLVELMMVLAIVTIALAVCAVRFTRTPILMSQGERVARTLVADLRRARSEAIATGRNHYLAFTDDGSHYSDYTLYRVEDAADAIAGPTRVVPDGVALLQSDSRCEFRPDGSALADYTYTVTCPGWKYTIQVTLATGAVTLGRQEN